MDTWLEQQRNELSYKPFPSSSARIPEYRGLLQLEGSLYHTKMDWMYA